VDKSDYRLYWIRNNQLVKAYPIAHGKNNCTPVAVWKVLSKERTDSRGVYGPRKLRLFRRSGSSGRYSYSYSNYGIHGTNEPWVIGTQASHGCIRMYNKDILELWPQVPLGTMVITRS
jgi:lipoprotein-anchoring transpeptidase ErfK/SrfK